MPRSGYDISGFGSWAVSQRLETDTKTTKQQQGGGTTATGTDTSGGSGGREDNKGRKGPPKLRRTAVRGKPEIKEPTGLAQ
ncbi:hypothetical protein VTG60DRAFT_2864 [Thermothelomyces hinnuleus]